MKSIERLVFVWVILLVSPLCNSQGNQLNDINYTLSPYPPSAQKGKGGIYIEQVTLRRSIKIGVIQTQKINADLAQLNKELRSEAASCRKDALPDHPWSYEVAFDRIGVVDDVISIVFKTFEVCGDPYIYYSVRKYSMSTGRPLSTKTLIQKYAPSLLEMGVKFKGNSVKLGENAAEGLVDQNDELSDEKVRTRCDEFLKTEWFSYVWVESGNLVLVPPFRHPDTVCHKKYLIKLENKNNVAELIQKKW